MAENTTYSVLQVIKKASAIYRRYFIELLIVSVITIESVNTIQPQMQSSDKMYVLISIILFLLVLNLGNATAIIMIDNYYRGESPGLKGIYDAFNKAYRKIFRILGTSMLTLALYISGFVLLVLPGIYLACIFLFSNSIAAIEDNDIGPLNLSYQLVKDDFYRVFNSGLIAYAVIIVPITLTYLVQINPTLSNIAPLKWIATGFHIVLWPFFMCLLVVPYLEMKQIKREIIPRVINKTVGTPMGCLLAFVSMGVAFMLMSMIFNYIQHTK